MEIPFLVAQDMARRHLPQEENKEVNAMIANYGQSVITIKHRPSIRWWPIFWITMTCIMFCLILRLYFLFPN
jgi:hypothetical protein